MTQSKHVDILIVDGHPVMRAGIRACLAARPDWRVCAEAGTGEAAVALAQRHRPRLVILDPALPSGLETVREFRRHIPDMGILIYTMHADECLVSDILKAGADGYVSKNDADVTLLAAVEAVAAGRQYAAPSTGRHVGKKVPCPSQILTPRQIQVVRLVAEGRTNRNIAHHLQVSVKTVESHRTAAMKKLDAHTVADLVHYAIRAKLIRL
ncbi:response regulator [Shinella zoogloeoides]|jgi:DNA-binding NarL/FixJ family response regulator|uniref:response regulator n=1 Tax=Shinella zoogloeoides TaxID=352475 RepID=UPI0028A85F4A|nr:response regulator [Shinella zoogloeoides]